MPDFIFFATDTILKNDGVLGFVMTFEFCVTSHEGTQARVGTITTPHGVIETPAFLFCATKGAIKGMSVAEIKAQNTQILLSNTYHLMLQPGADRVAALGGIHRFMGWNGPVFTDSGGYQIFAFNHGGVSCEIKRSGSAPRKKQVSRISEEGAEFISYIDGRKHLLTPEESIEVQRKLGADLICIFDECTPFHETRAYTEASTRMSHRWALRSLQAFQRHDDGRQALYGIVQGGVYPDLRRESAELISSLPFFGRAVGGCLGATPAQMYEVVGMSLEHLSRKGPIHLLGIGGINDILAGVSMGIDTFDCVSPTRLGRHGGALITPAYWDDANEEPHERESINLHKACFRDDPRPIDASCPCETCQHYSRAYLHHLLKAKELLGMQALVLHNMRFMNRFMSAIRDSIRTNTFANVRANWAPLARNKAAA